MFSYGCVTRVQPPGTHRADPGSRWVHSSCSGLPRSQASSTHIPGDWRILWPPLRHVRGDGCGHIHSDHKVPRSLGPADPAWQETASLHPHTLDSRTWSVAPWSFLSVSGTAQSRTARTGLCGRELHPLLKLPLTIAGQFQRGVGFQHLHGAGTLGQVVGDDVVQLTA